MLTNLREKVHDVTEHPATMETPDMEVPSSKEGREAKELKKATITTLGEEVVDLRPMDVQIRTSVAQKGLGEKEENRFIKVKIHFNEFPYFDPLSNSSYMRL